MVLIFIHFTLVCRHLDDRKPKALEEDGPISSIKEEEEVEEFVDDDSSSKEDEEEEKEYAKCKHY